jgi:glycerate kinase
MKPMKVVIAPDSFKESLSATEVAGAIEKNICNFGEMNIFKEL